MSDLGSTLGVTGAVIVSLFLAALGTLANLDKGISALAKTAKMLKLAPVDAGGALVPPWRWSKPRLWTASAVTALLLGGLTLWIVAEVRDRLYDDYLFQATITRPLVDVPNPPPDPSDIRREFEGTVRNRDLGSADAAAQEVAGQIVDFLIARCYLAVPGSTTEARITFAAGGTAGPTVEFVPALAPTCRYDLFYRPVDSEAEAWTPLVADDEEFRDLDRDFFLRIVSPHHLTLDRILVPWQQGLDQHAVRLTPLPIPIVLTAFDGEGREGDFQRHLTRHLTNRGVWVIASFADYESRMNAIREQARTNPRIAELLKPELECFDRKLRVFVGGWYGSP